jgi:hypothetical protein
VDYAHDSGIDAPGNALSRLPGTLIVQGANATPALNARAIDISASMSIDGAPFPIGQSASLSLISEPGLLGLGNSGGNWPTRRALQGRYRVLYGYDSGLGLPRNVAYQRLCVDAEPCLHCDGFESPP